MSEALATILRAISRPAIAVSGGVDSVTLAAFAHECTDDVKLFHAASPAVPVAATERLTGLAARYGWHLTIVRAGEFDDPDYRKNPVNRCFYCKTNLYGTIGARTERPILSGANLDDLGEYRPGLVAARLHEVRHPYIEAAIGKSAVRDLARRLGLDEVSELPSSPCLSSRVETGIRIEPAMLRFIQDVERLLDDELEPATVRCRVRAAAIVVELDEQSLERVTEDGTRRLTRLIEAHEHRPRGKPVSFERYRNGSAFLVGRPQ